MGKYLQIRVSAATFDPAALEKAFPALCKTAWGPLGRPETGEADVLRLAEALHDVVRFGEITAERKAALAEGAERLFGLKEALEAALADWDPRRADALSYDVEDLLAAMEKSCA